MISQERLKIEVKLLLNAKSYMYMPRRLAQQITFSDLEWPFHASRAISAVAELLLLCASKNRLAFLNRRQSYRYHLCVVHSACGIVINQFIAHYIVLKCDSRFSFYKDIFQDSLQNSTEHDRK